PSLVSGLTPASYFSTLGDPQEFDFHAVDLAHADFAPIDLAAGEYWIGLSSANNTDISWASYERPDGTQERPLSDQLQLAGNNFVVKPGIHDLAFRIDGAFASAVPEPETWVLFILGFGFIGTFMRKAGMRKAGIRKAGPRPAFALARATRRR
ncbi:MAG: PEPxxWA-CTERM sorting domain-containing protein, partial [Rhizomicrobium sp.]